MFSQNPAPNCRRISVEDGKRADRRLTLRLRAAGQAGLGAGLNKFDGNRSGMLRSALWLPLAAAALSASGCVSGPTYGTGVGSETQLASDVSNIFSIAPKSRPKIDYEPRPELVRPAGPTKVASLPAPQQKVATAGNPDWPESPEQRRARLRDEATANQDNPFYKPQIAGDAPAAASLGPQVAYGAGTRYGDIGGPVKRSADANGNSAERRERIKQQSMERKQGDPTTRRYLSDPPLAYRQAADTAPTGDIGEDEWKKEKRLKAEAKAKSGKKGGWFDWLPGT